MRPCLRVVFVSMLRCLRGYGLGGSVGGWLTDGADGGHVEDDGECLLKGWEAG